MKETRKHLYLILTDLLFVAVAVYVMYETATRFAAAGAASGGALTNAAFYPRILAVLMLVLTLCDIAKHSYRLWQEHQAIQQGPEAEKTIISSGGLTLKNLWLAFGCLAWFWLYICWLDTLGYVIATPIMLMCLFVALGIRNPLVNIAYASGVSLGIYLLFQETLDVVLPIGLLARWMG